MKKMKIFAALAALGLILTGCSSGSSAVEKLGIEEFAAKAAEPNIVVLDVRTPGEFAQGHLANAINIDFESGYFEQEIAKLDKNATYAVYCRSGNRSGQAVKVMADLGFTDMYDMDGGVIDWAAAGKPLYTN
jgi:rhodanese-related sulfurtransferase